MLTKRKMSISSSHVGRNWKNLDHSFTGRCRARTPIAFAKKKDTILVGDDTDCILLMFTNVSEVANLRA